jgi:hypothetical protein
MATSQLILFGIPTITMLGVQLIAQPLFAAGVTNGFGHAGWLPKL